MDRPRVPSFDHQVTWRPNYTILVLALAANFSSMTARLAISPLVPDITATFGVSNGLIGLALTGMWAAYAIVQFPSGVLGERYGERRVILLALVLSAAGALLLAVSPSFLLFALFAVGLGAGASLYFPVATVFISRKFDNQGQALGFHTMGAPLAGIAAPVAAASLAVRFGWRTALLIAPVLIIPAAILFARYVEPTPPVDPEGSLRDRIDPGILVELLSRPPVAFTTVIGCITVFTWQAYASFFPTFLIEFWGISTQRASIAFGGVFVVSAVGLPVLGRLSDRFSRDWTLAAALAATALGLGIFLVGTSLLLISAGVLVMGVGMGWGGVIQSRFMDLFSEEERGTGYGFVRSVYMFIGASGSVVTGALADAAGWPVAFGLVIAILAVAVLALAANRLLATGF